MDDLFADNCHLNPETPKPDKSAAQAAADWTTSTAGEVWSTVTNRQAMAQIGTGVFNYIKNPTGALKDASFGIAVRAVGGVLGKAAAGIAAAVPSASYLIARESTMLILKGPDAASEDTIKLVTAPFTEIAKVNPAAQVLSNPQSTEAQIKAANLDIQNAGATFVSPFAMGLGVAVGPEGLRTIARTTATGARTVAMELGRASFPFGDPPALAPAYAPRVQLPPGELMGMGTSKGSPTIPVAVAPEKGTVLLNQIIGGDRGNKTPTSDGATTGTEAKPDLPVTKVYTERDEQGRIIFQREEDPVAGTTRSTTLDGPSGRTKAERVHYPDGLDVDEQFDIATENCRLRDIAFPDHVRILEQNNPATGELMSKYTFDSGGDRINHTQYEGNRTLDEKFFSDGRQKRVHYDASGNVSVEIQTNPDGSTLESHTHLDGSKLKFRMDQDGKIQYEPSDDGVDSSVTTGSDASELGDTLTENAMPIDWRKPDGTIGHTEYYDGTKSVKYSVVTKPGGPTVYTEFDPVTGNKRSTYEKHPDGTWDYETYRPEGLAEMPLYRDFKNSEGLEGHMTYDGAGKVSSYALTGPDGSPRLVQHDQVIDFLRIQHR